MSLLKILGIFDGVCTVVFILTHFFPVSPGLLYIVGFYLLIKGVLFTIFFKDIASMLDMGCGLYALMIIMGFYNAFITTIAALYLAQKSILSIVRIK